jgi:hypothetical protein
MIFMPRIKESNVKGLNEMMRHVSVSQADSKSSPSFGVEENSHSNGGVPEKKIDDDLSFSATRRQPSHLDMAAKSRDNVPFDSSKKSSFYGEVAESAYRRGLPLVYQTSKGDMSSEGVVIVLHGQDNKRASLIDGQELLADDSNELASRCLIGLNDTQSSQDYWNTKRVVVAAMFHIGLLVNQDKAMARQMLSTMSANERGFGFNGALEECLGQNPELVQAVIDLGGKPNEESSDDGMLPLEKAIRRNSQTSVKALLEKGARVDLETSSSGLTPLEYAEQFGSNEVKSLLQSWTEK